MEVTGQLHIPVASPAGKIAPVLFVKKTELNSYVFWAVTRRKVV